jgi:hypothetical protein
MKTLADLKRALQVGKIITCIYGPRGIKGKRREVVKVQTNAVILIDPDAPGVGELRKKGKGSYLEFPKASLVEVTDKGFKIYDPGSRDLTEDEKAVIRMEPKDSTQDEIDMLVDGSVMFHRRKRYYEAMDFEYLFIGDKNRRINSHDRTKVIDSDVKGDLSLEYRFEG